MLLRRSAGAYAGLLLAVAAAVCSCAAAAGASSLVGVPELAGARDAGPLPKSALVHLAFVLPYRANDDLERLIDAQGDPTSPLRGRFLSPAQFAQAFAPDAGTYARLAATLVRDGFTVERTFPNRTLIDAAAPAATVERTFATTLRAVRTADGAQHYANVTPARVPADLARDADVVAGLDDLDVVRTAHVLGAPQRPRATRVSPNGQPLYGPAGGYGPDVTSLAYDLPVEHAGGNGAPYDGTGRSTAVTICGNFLESDLATFLAYFQITRTGPATIQIPVDGGGKFVPFDREGCSEEATLDVETIVGNAPGTQLRMYTVPTLSFKHILDDYEQVITDNVVDTVNSSYGECEINRPSFSRAANRLAAQGTALGITFVASTGDYGSIPPNCQNKKIAAPASSPHFVGVGGTTLSVDAQGNYVSEAGWSGSGGGVSVLFKQPAYQKGVTGTSPSGRTLPDVSFDADPNSGAAFAYDGGWPGVIGGTSWSSPLFCALVTERDQIAGARAANAHRLLYHPFKTQGYVVFRDITTGNNGYPAGPGYDDVTGIGSVIGYPWAQQS